MRVQVKKAGAARSLSNETINYLINFGDIAVGGYTPLAECPEIAAGVQWLADIIASMTLHVMENRESGDVRVKDELAKFLDVHPWRQGTRQLLVSWIVRQLIVEGNACCLIRTRDGYLDELVPMPGASYQASADGLSYTVLWKGMELDPAGLLHFALDPDPRQPWKGVGVRVTLQQVADSLAQAETTKTAFMSSEYKPPLIVSVNALAEGFDTPEGRRKLLADYVTGMESGQPWVIPGDLMKVDSVKPLSLNDIALKDGVELDRHTAAAVLGIPAYALGVGTFNKDEYNNAIRTRVHAICTCIEQTMTARLILSEKRYVRFNPRSMFAYDLKEVADIYKDLRAAGLATGNEVRDQLGLSPLKGLDELVMLDNYIPVAKLGAQKKLVQDG